jgi:hypothetical protein
VSDLLFKCPDDLFQQIEERVLRRPELLSMDEYHTLPDGSEAGWIIALTPKAPEFERLRDNVDDFANEILVANGRLPIPFGIFYGDNASGLKLIRGRAAEERLNLNGD